MTSFSTFFLLYKMYTVGVGREWDRIFFGIVLRYWDWNLSVGVGSYTNHHFAVIETCNGITIDRKYWQIHLQVICGQVMIGND